MKKTLGIFFAVALLLCQIAWADQPTTVLTETRTAGGVALDVPVLDGVNNETFQQSANQLLSEAAQDTARKTGRQGKVTYEVTLNRPSLVSILFKGTNGGHAYYRALNIDLTTGREFTPDTFFFNNDARKALLGAKTENTLFTEEGIALSAKNGAPYDRLYSYGQLMPMARIGEIGRLLTVWKLTESSNGNTLTVRPGSLLAIKLSANPSTGFQWVPVITGGVDKGLTKVGSTFAIPHDTPEGQTGTPGTEVQFYTAQQPGTYTLKLSYERPWEKMSAFRTCLVTVIVK